MKNELKVFTKGKTTSWCWTVCKFECLSDSNVELNYSCCPLEAFWSKKLKFFIADSQDVLFPRNMIYAYHLLWLALPFLAAVSPPLIFRESNRFFILELAGSSFFFLRLFTPAPEVTEGRRSAANPHAGTESAVWLELRLRTSPCWRSHALSRQSTTKRSSCVALTFLLMFRVISNGFWMYKGDVSGLISSFPCRKGTKKYI